MRTYPIEYLDSKFDDIEKMRKVMSINEHHLRLRVVALENKVLQQSEQIKQLIEKLEGKISMILTPETAFNKKAPHGVSVFVYRGKGQGQTITCNTAEQLAQLLSEHSLISLEVKDLDAVMNDSSFLARVRQKVKQWDVSPTFAVWWIGSESIRLLKAEELVDCLLGFNDVTILEE